jgi:hypothetical protein
MSLTSFSLPGKASESRWCSWVAEVICAMTQCHT